MAGESTLRRGTWRFVWGIFAVPGRAFAALSENHNWLPPYLVSAAVSLAAGLAALPATVKLQVEMTRRIIAAQAPEAAAQMAGLETIQRIAGYAGAIVGPWVVPLVVAAVIAFVVWLTGVIGRDGITYARLYGMTMWAILPAGVTLAVLQAVWIILTPTDAAVAAGGRLDASLALAFPGLAHTTWAYRLLYSANLFTLWTALLIGLGYAAFSRRPTWRAALAGLLYWAVSAATAIYGLISTQAALPIK